MSGNIPFEIPHVGAKWQILRRKGAARGLPQTKKALARALTGVKGTSDTNVSDILNGIHPGSPELHEAILKIYGVDWPCPEYFDYTGGGRDQDLEEFRRVVNQPDEYARFRPVDNPNFNMQFDPSYFSMQLDYARLEQALSVGFDGRAIECVDTNSRFGVTPVGTIRFKTLVISVSFDQSEPSVFPESKRRIERPDEDMSDGLRINARSSDFGHVWEIDSPPNLDENALAKGATPYMAYSTPTAENTLVVRVRSRFPYFSFNEVLVSDQDATKNDLEKILAAHLENKISRVPQNADQRPESDSFLVFVQMYRLATGGNLNDPEL